MNTSHALLASLCASLVYPCCLNAADTEKTWSEERVKNLAKGTLVADSKSPDILQMVHNLYPDRKDGYTETEMKAALADTKKKDIPFRPEKIHQKGRPPPGTLSRAEALDTLAGYELMHPGSKDLAKALYARYGVQDWYTGPQIAATEKGGMKHDQEDVRLPKTDPVGATYYAAEDAVQKRNASAAGLLDGFKMPLVRQSWRDVLTAEDPSVPADLSKLPDPSKPPATAIKDLVGATLSYTHDGKAGTDTWNAQGALIFPWVHDWSPTGGWTPLRIAVAPSVTVNRIDTNGDPKTETDTLLYRVGFYSSWLWADSPVTGQFIGLDLRAAGVYATTTGGAGRLPGYELDLEPRWMNGGMPLGYQKGLFPTHRITTGDGTDLYNVYVQARAWLHLEGGEVQDTGKSWDPTLGSFSRMGPNAMLQVTAPHLVFGKDFSLIGMYSYLPALTGTSPHDTYFHVTAVLDLVKNDATGHKVSINADYQHGGLSFTKQDVDLFTMGLGIRF